MNRFELINVGEIRFGPPYYELYIDRLKVKDKLFGKDYCVFENGKYVAFQEWLSIDYSRGPVTRVFLVNISDLTYFELSDGKKGFVGDFSFDSEVFSYVLLDKGKGTTRSFECDLDNLQFKDLSLLLAREA